MRSGALLLACATLLPLAASLMPACASSGPSDQPTADLARAVDLGVSDLAMSSDGPPRTSCDLGSGAPATERLFLAATTAAGGSFTALRVGGAWSPVAVAGGNLLALVATDLANRPLVIGRQGDDALVGAIYEPCADVLPAPSPLFNLALTAERPAPVGGSSVDLVFRGSLSGDQRLYHTRYDGSWQPAVALGNFLSVLPPTALRVGADVHTLFTGTDGSIYDGLVDTSGGVGTLTSATSDRGPAALSTSDGTTYVVWKGMDTNLYWIARPSGGAYSAPRSLCEGQSACLIASNEAPVLALDRGGAPSVAWIGKDSGVVYTARLDVAGGTWSTALAAAAEATMLLPALAPGLPGAELELVYVRAADGMGRHVEKANGTFSAATDVPGGPLGSRPSLVRLGP